jgi:hypothetical protein
MAAEIWRAQPALYDWRKGLFEKLGDFVPMPKLRQAGLTLPGSLRKSLETRLR